MMERKRWIARVLTPLLFTFAGPAAAQGQGPPLVSEPDRPSTFTIQAQGGVLLFPGEAQDRVGTGIGYGGLIAWKPLPLLGVEASYQGANYQSSGDVGGPQTSIFENGGQLLLRVGPRLRNLEPYVLAGGAFSHVTVRNDRGVVRDIRDDTVAKVPLGVGLDWHLQPLQAKRSDTHVVLGLRGAYQLVFFDDFLPTLESGRGADQIAISFLIGVGF